MEIISSDFPLAIKLFSAHLLVKHFTIFLRSLEFPPSILNYYSRDTLVFQMKCGLNIYRYKLYYIRVYSSKIKITREWKWALYRVFLFCVHKS